MLGLISAMGAEMELLAGVLEDAMTERQGGVIYQRGRLFGREAVLSVCGAGKVNAALCAQAMILRYQPEGIINLGVAGSLSPKLSIGDVVIGTYAVQHDMDTTPIGDPPGLVSGVGLVRFELDEGLRDRLVHALASLADIRGMTGGIATGDQFLVDPMRKERVKELFGTVCCEMEGGAVAHACRLSNVPCAVVRAISDNADGDSPVDFFRFLRKAAENSMRLVKAFISEEQEPGK